MALQLRLTAVALSAALLQPAGASQAAEVIKLQPHRAIYDLSLSGSASGSGLNEMNGRLVYELTGAACEGYTQNMRFVTRSTTSDGSEQVNDIRTSSFEEATGERLDFSTTHHHDNQTQVTEGRAARIEPAKGGAALKGGVAKDPVAKGGVAKETGATEAGVKVKLRQPEARELSLPATVYFPIQHSVALIKAARQGEKRFIADIYDGSEKGDKVSATTTVIGKPGVASAETVPEVALAKLKGVPYWPISTSYYEKTKQLGNQDAVPNYEMSARFFENGVSTRLMLDYGDFALKGELKEISYLPEPTCAQGK
jgi:hypothetical protein